MKVFHGLKGIISGTILIIGGSWALQPMDWHNAGLVVLFVLMFLVALSMILIGSLTLKDKPAKPTKNDTANFPDDRQPK